jgi:polysaccharide biosynthesis protein PelE
MSEPANVIRAACAVAALAAVAVLQFAAAWRVVHAGPASIDPLLAVFALASVGGLAQALLFRMLLPCASRAPRAWTLAWLWLACTFVPLFGGIVVLAGCASAAWLPARTRTAHYGDVPPPQFVSYLISRVSHGGGARLQARLTNTRVAASDRLSALAAIQSMPTRTTGRLLRELLADPIEDVRLVAYGTLDRAENEIMQQIFRTSQMLEAAGSDGERDAVHRRLAELYFELVYQNLVQDAVFLHTLDQADHHARTALEADDSDAALWLIRGRVALVKGQPDEAGRYIDRAEALGFPRERLVLWLAESAFVRGDYARVRQLLDSRGNNATLPVLKPVVHYWSS